MVKIKPKSRIRPALHIVEVGASVHRVDLEGKRRKRRRRRRRAGEGGERGSTNGVRLVTVVIRLGTSETRVLSLA